MKVGILARDFMEWTGGVDFLGTVMDSLVAAPRGQKAEFHLLIPDVEPRWTRVKHQTRQKLRELVSGKPGPSPTKTAPALFSTFGGRITIHHLEKSRRALAPAARELKLDVILPALHTLGGNFPLPWVGYAYDFQHKYFPELFTPKNCISRDEHFTDMLTTARAVIVNSRAVAGDIARFVPEATARVFTLPFAPSPDPSWSEDCPEILSRHGVKALLPHLKPILGSQRPWHGL